MKIPEEDQQPVHDLNLLDLQVRAIVGNPGSRILDVVEETGGQVEIVIGFNDGRRVHCICHNLDPALTVAEASDAERLRHYLLFG